MKLIKNAVITAIALFSIANAKPAEKTLFLIEPPFDSTTIGVTTSVDERAELYKMITEHCANFFKVTIKTADPSEINVLEAKKADFLIWNLEHYHFLFDDQEHEACIKATLYRFSASNEYNIPIFAASPPMLVGGSSYGDVAPLREGIDSYFRLFRKTFNRDCTGNASMPNVSAEEILQNDPLRGAADKVYVLVSPLNDSTVGSDPMDYEIVHLPRMVAHFVGKLVKRAPVVIDESVASQLKQQSIVTKLVRVELHNYGNGNNELGFTLYQSPEIDKPIFSMSVKDPRREGWKMNDDFQKGLEAIFKIIAKQMESPFVGKQ